MVTQVEDSLLTANARFVRDVNELSVPHPIERSQRVWSNEVIFAIRILGASIWLFDIMSLYPGKRNASKMLDAFCHLADRHQVDLCLNVAPIGRRRPERLTKTQLVKWYQKRGFVKSADREHFVRKPQ